MGMAAYGEPIYRDLIWQDFIATVDPPLILLSQNVHRGIRGWRPEIEDGPSIAASIQQITEELMVGLASWVAKAVRSKNLVLMGGVALNCVANTKIAESGLFEDVWIMPNPGDGGASIGAVAAYTAERVGWVHPFLGHDIDRPFDVSRAAEALAAGEVVGIANGRAEFGPRALGNRSLVADPRGAGTKDKVNAIKLREPFRPFAPAVMAQHARDYFEVALPNSPYMQFVAKVRHPAQFPAICHEDDTARLQTVTQAENPSFYRLLEEFHKRTGCPMLLNTSLNLKGEPLVNTWSDAERFAAKTGVRVF